MVDTVSSVAELELGRLLDALDPLGDALDAHQAVSAQLDFEAGHHFVRVELSGVGDAYLGLDVEVVHKAEGVPPREDKETVTVTLPEFLALVRCMTGIARDLVKRGYCDTVRKETAS